MSFRTEFEKIARLEEEPGLSTTTQKALADYYTVVHSPGLKAAITGLKWGLPSAVLSALASPQALRTRNALFVGGTIGAITGLAAATQQAYSNAAEKSHLLYHLDQK